mgnify:CR=1 FL=1
MKTMNHIFNILASYIMIAKQIILKNLSVCDAGMKFGKKHLQIQFYQKSTLTTYNLEMAAIFSRWRLYGILVLKKKPEGAASIRIFNT